MERGEDIEGKKGKEKRENRIRREYDLIFHSSINIHTVYGAK